MGLADVVALAEGAPAEAETAAEAGADPEAGAEAELETEADASAEIDAEADTSAEAEADVESLALAEALADAEALAEAEAEDAAGAADAVAVAIASAVAAAVETAKGSVISAGRLRLTSSKPPRAVVSNIVKATKMIRKTKLDPKMTEWNFRSDARCMKNVATTVALMVAMKIATIRFTVVPIFTKLAPNVSPVSTISAPNVFR